MKLIIISIIIFLFSYQFNSNKFIVEYELIIPSKTEKEIEERIERMKKIVPEPELQEKIAASFIRDNSPVISHKKLICEGVKGVYTNLTLQNQPIKLGDFNLFFDMKNEKYLAQSYIFDKPFIVEKDVTKLDWTYTDETKQIGAFKAKKAIAKKDTTFFAEVWYTNDLPAFPIEGLFGIKGGVVEATFTKGEKLRLKNFTTTFSKDDVIEKPSKGKKLTQQEYNKLEKQKIDEVNEQARNSRKN